MTPDNGPLRPQRTAPRDLRGLAQHLSASVAADLDAAVATGITLRSQDVRPGDVFAALPGAATHGAAFAAAARAAGAVALLTDAAGAALAVDAGLPTLVVDDPRRVLGDAAAWLLRTEDAVPLLLGMTGTNGKTTTVTLLDHLLRRLGRRTGISTTAERVVDGVRIPSRLTTPEADELHGLLAAMRERRVDAAAIEVSAQALVRARVAGVRFDVAGFTNLSHDHLDDFGDMATYFAAKAALFEPDRARRGVVSLDSPWGARLAAEARIPVTTVALHGDADWRVAITERSLDGTRFRATAPDGRVLETRVRMLGDHAAADAALAAVMLVEGGVALDAIQEALGDDGFDVAVPGRLERLPSSACGPAVHLDVAHTPDAFEKSLAALRAVTPGRIVMVFGADGDRDPSKRFDMGRVASSTADVVVITDHHSRFEDPEAIRRTLLQGARSTGRAEVLEVPDPGAGIRAAVAMTGPGDAVLWAGTGRTDYRDIGGTKLPYSFHDEARAALAELQATAA
ncbi:UDP-N-acetylmuramoyl-L-alanyl-D-glutamate--2,6-diaminopimelate ligase [Amnibacterium soli]|uniref:UDP-N-acetylmuramyl-tripeptide synthetase n=1 Tax=Amnibacterium soli TaxID=1282736 RepID=A0ABP8YPE5_9MICO